MKLNIKELAFRLPGEVVSPDAEYFRPTQWPPPNDWCVSINSKGEVLSTWESDDWDYTYLAGKKLVLRFRNLRRKANVDLSHENRATMKHLAGWLIWWPQGASSWNSLKVNFIVLRRIAYICDDNGILLRELERFPEVIKKIALKFTKPHGKRAVLLLLERLRNSKHELGFVILESKGLSEFAAAGVNVLDADDGEQTAYIPPRIWIYQNLRLRECLDEFLLHEDSVRDCYNFCVDAYAVNYGSLEKAMCRESSGTARNPFSNSEVRKEYSGSFEDITHQFGVNALLKSWVGPAGNAALDIRHLGKYLTLIQAVSVMYIANFTLQRREEIAALKADCFKWEADELVGKMAVICGETTKTIKDSDARWPTSPSVEVAVIAASSVARMRLRCAMAVPAMECTAGDIENPFLWHYATDPWYGSRALQYQYAVQKKLIDCTKFIYLFPRLFDEEALRITAPDLKMARLFTPNLDKKGHFAVGKVWPLAFHQFRRTAAINMFASDLVSHSSIQVIMKHRTSWQSAYYGRNFTHLRFNEEFLGIANAAKYEVMAARFTSFVETRFVSPLGDSRKSELAVNLVNGRDFKALVAAATCGEISFRATRLGGCTTREACVYGGVESISRCAGGDGAKPCRDAVFDKSKREAAQRALVRAEADIREVEPNSPRAKAMEKEIRGLRNFLDATED